MKPNLNYQRFRRNTLPHIQTKDGIFFITFRLNIQLDEKFSKMLGAKKNEIYQSLRCVDNSAERSILFNKKLFAFQDNYYDTYKSDSNYLLNTKCAHVLHNEVLNYNQILYDLYAFTVMPNHVHFLCKPLADRSNENYSLPYIMSRIKGRTARFINLEVGRTGRLWQHEYYDHYVRNEQEMNNIVRYILMNPVKAGLANKPALWEWSWVSQEFLYILEEDVIREDGSVWISVL